MITIGIQDKNTSTKGTVIYDPDTKEVKVNFPNSELDQEVKQYLTTKRTYRIPVGPGIDQDREDVAFPTDSAMYFDLAMCCLYAKTGVWVDWSTEREF